MCVKKEGAIFQNAVLKMRKHFFKKCMLKKRKNFLKNRGDWIIQQREASSSAWTVSRLLFSGAMSVRRAEGGEKSLGWSSF